MLKKIIVLIVVVFVIFSAYQAMVAIDGDGDPVISEGERKNKIVRDILDGINTQAPIMVDEDTRLEKAYERGEAVVIEYSFPLLSSDELDVEKFKETSYSNTVSLACNSKQFLDVLNEGIVITTLYNDKNGSLISEISVERSLCN